MQQALPVAFGAEPKFSLAKSRSRPNKFLVSGAALVCAGAMAVNPVAPTSALADIQQREVQLAAWVNPVLEDPLALWGSTFTTAFTQVGEVGAAIAANPFPVLNQIVENQKAYLEVLIGAKAAEGQRRGTGIIGAAESVGKSIDDLPVRMQAAFDFIVKGEISEAFVEINTWSLRLLEAVAWPMLPVFAVPGAMIDAVGRVYESLVGRGAFASISKGLMAPPLSVAFALTNVVDQVIRSMKSGDIEEVFTAVINTPAIAVGAFFNGYRPMFGYDEAGEPILSPEFFPGVFSPGGFIDALFVQLPNSIAEALKPPVEATVATPPTAGSTLVTLDVSVPGTTDEPAVTTPEVDSVSAVEVSDVAVADQAEAASDATENEGTPEADSATAVVDEDAALVDDAEVATDAQDADATEDATATEDVEATEGAEDTDDSAVQDADSEENDSAAGTSDATSESAGDSDSDEL
ncbi:hypothetical protein NGTWS0302_32010 [Mycolicibacterium cyprinidarum]|uniref:PE-PGRS family protein n=1 Tax=Mycolicibacterium cyprinidarum TaxID=2860311 RepID=A0ABQ4V4J7_9MYCO|nr:hypothetical protein NGTWS1702_05180 [Mycolicibacterium sp. NGTWSNA01]GJF12717.1 hypothetical protein NGTWS0302_32010 [Mycolicibacterium sp. NGTWS0302]